MTPTMKTATPRPKTTRFLIPALLLGALAPLVASEVLFEDSFGASLRPGEVRANDIDYLHDKRQTGALAPAAYTHSGGEWQAQTRGFGKRIGFLIFPKKEWLDLTPALELPDEDGSYEFSFEFSCPSGETALQGDQKSGPPGEVALVIGRDQSAGPDDPGWPGTLAVVLPVEPEGPARFMIDGVEAAFLDSTATGGPATSRRRNLTIRWTQSGGRVTKAGASVDGQDFPPPAADPSFSLSMPRIMVASRLITKLHSEQNYGQIQLIRLTLSKE
jgi:hypothetical protein